MSIGANTFAFFTRNPRGSKAKPENPADTDAALELLHKEAFGPLVAHGAYTMNLCTADADARAYRDMVFEYNKDNDLYSRNFTEKQYIDSKNDAEYNKKVQEAQIAASYGNFDKLVELGLMSPDEAAFNANAYRYQNTPKVSGGGGGGDKTSKYMNMVKADADALNWLFSLEGPNGETFMYEGWNSNTNPLYAAKDKLKNKEAVAFLKANLVLNGFDPSDADKKISEYKKMVATEIASAEGQGKTVDDVIERYKWLK
jgi:hypothetical protein